MSRLPFRFDFIRTNGEMAASAATSSTPHQRQRVSSSHDQANDLLEIEESINGDGAAAAPSAWSEATTPSQLHPRSRQMRTSLFNSAMSACMRTNIRTAAVKQEAAMPHWQPVASVALSFASNLHLLCELHEIVHRHVAGQVLTSEHCTIRSHEIEATCPSASSPCHHLPQIGEAQSQAATGDLSDHGSAFRVCALLSG